MNNCVFGSLISDVACNYVSAAGGRDGLWGPALPGHWLSYTGCWQSLLVMYWLYVWDAVSILTTYLGCFGHVICFSNNGLNMLPWTSLTCYPMDNQQGCFRLSNWFPLWHLAPWMNPLPPARLSTFRLTFQNESWYVSLEWYFIYLLFLASDHGFMHETSDFFNLYSIKTFSYTKYFVHSYTVDVVFIHSCWDKLVVN